MLFSNKDTWNPGVLSLLKAKNYFHFCDKFSRSLTLVCAYKDGKVIIDTAAGVLGKDDPRAVQPDSLFPVFSVTKGVTAGLIHWLADKGYVYISLTRYR
ncbi:putative beta-lactamase/transpeptidase [Helianthus anomalus]